MLKEMTKRQLTEWLNAYDHSTIYSLWDAYKTPSQAKFNAWLDCLDAVQMNGGYGAKIISYNTQVFTFGFKSERVENGTKFIFLHVITKGNYYVGYYRAQ